MKIDLFLIAFLGLAAVVVAAELATDVDNGVIDEQAELEQLNALLKRFKRAGGGRGGGSSGGGSRGGSSSGGSRPSSGSSSSSSGSRPSGTSSGSSGSSSSGSRPSSGSSGSSSGTANTGFWFSLGSGGTSGANRPASSGSSSGTANGGGSSGSLGSGGANRPANGGASSATSSGSNPANQQGFPPPYNPNWQGGAPPPYSANQGAPPPYSPNRQEAAPNAQGAAPPPYSPNYQGGGAPQASQNIRPPAYPYQQQFGGGWSGQQPPRGQGVYAMPAQPAHQTIVVVKGGPSYYASPPTRTSNIMSGLVGGVVGYELGRTVSGGGGYRPYTTHNHYYVPRTRYVYVKETDRYYYYGQDSYMEIREVGKLQSVVVQNNATSEAAQALFPASVAMLCTFTLNDSASITYLNGTAINEIVFECDRRTHVCCELDCCWRADLNITAWMANSSGLSSASEVSTVTRRVQGLQLVNRMESSSAVTRRPPLNAVTILATAGFVSRFFYC